MVGVPRSSGCRICVQRRVRCDGARPICNNCRKGNRPCPGYGAGVKFQDEGPKLREKYQKGTFIVPTNEEDNSDADSLALVYTPKSSESHRPDHEGIKHWNILGMNISPENAKKRMNVYGFVEGKTLSYLGIDLLRQRGYDDASVPHDTDVPVQLDFWPVITEDLMSPEAQQIQLLSKFTESITPPESRFLPKAMRAQGTWLSQLPDLTGAHQLLDSAIRAVTLVHIGRLHKNEQFIMESRPYYGKALRCLNTAIADKKMGMDNKTLCATILLSFYEMFASDEDMSWVRHAGGAGTLMRMRGPQRHRYGLDRDIFLAYRNTLLIEAFSRDQPSFLDEPEWRQLTREIYGDLLSANLIPPERVGIYDIAEEFYSQMAAISVALAKVYPLNSKIETSGLSDDDDAQSVYSNLHKLHTSLQHLFRRWQTIMKKLGFDPPLLPVNDPVISFQYQYSNVFISSFYVGFWTTLMLVNSGLSPLALALGKDVSNFATENEECAVNSCRSVDFMLRSSFLGPFFTVYALRFAFRTFKLGDIRGDWVLCKLIDIGDRRLMFAKGAFGGGQNANDKPIDFYEGAKKRLDLYNENYRLLNQAVDDLVFKHAFNMDNDNSLYSDV